MGLADYLSTEEGSLYTPTDKTLNLPFLAIHNEMKTKKVIGLVLKRQIAVADLLLSFKQDVYHRSLVMNNKRE